MFLAWLACAEDPFPRCEDEPPPLRTDVPTWHGEVRALVERRCAGCHVDGGIGGFALDSYDAAAAWAPAMAADAEAGTMPPWPPLDCCRPLKHRLALDPEEIAALTAWSDGGAPEGNEADYVAPPPPTPGLPRIDRTVAMTEAYTPSPPDGGTDDTRCFLLDWPEEEKRFVTGFGVRPGVPGEVHHVMALTASVAAAPSLELLDAADAGPGWSCPGGIVLGATGWIGAWSPGWAPREMPEGTGQRMDPSDQVVLTVHYSVQNGAPAPDRTAVDLMLADDVESSLLSIPVFDPLWLTTLRVPAGEPHHVVRYDLKPRMERQIVGVNLHLHERGKSAQLGLRRADGTEECLLQIDDWAHEWQGDYLLEEPLALHRGDELFVECVFDNTAGNQRVIDGVPEDPRPLTWAEDEEMCVGFVQTRDP